MNTMNTMNTTYTDVKTAQTYYESARESYITCKIKELLQTYVNDKEGALEALESDICNHIARLQKDLFRVEDRISSILDDLTLASRALSAYSKHINADVKSINANNDTE